ncbi:MAG: 3'-5' exonuclease [Gemmatimonadota bacterium]
MTAPDDEHERMAAALTADGGYRILRKLGPLVPTSAPAGARLTRGLVLDVETTGFDSGREAIIQLSAIPFDYAPDTGLIHLVGPLFSAYEDPGRPISAEITALTGITDEMVRGQRIDDAAAAALAESAALVIAHNAGFDRPFVEKRIPAFRSRPWACSLSEIDWRPAGYPSSALAVLTAWHCEAFFDAHRADADCLALLHLLARPFKDGSLPLGKLLESARKTSVRIYATDAAFDKKELLKARRYKWSNGEEGKKRAWYRECSEDKVEAEFAWLTDQVYGGTRDKWQVEKNTARERYRAPGGGSSSTG